MTVFVIIIGIIDAILAFLLLVTDNLVFTLLCNALTSIIYNDVKLGYFRAMFFFYFPWKKKPPVFCFKGL